jgi:hypothetical protein
LTQTQPAARAKQGFLNAFAVQSLPELLPTATIRWIGPFREFIGLSILNRSANFRARDTLILNGRWKLLRRVSSPDALGDVAF